MSLLDRFSRAASSALDYVRRPTSRIPDGAIVFDPILAWRWTCEYTPASLKQLRATCNFREVINLCDAMLTDDRLNTVLRTRAQGLVGSPLDFQEGRGRRKARALRAVEAEADYWEIIVEEEYLQMHVWGLLANFGPGRLKWWERNRAGKFVPRVRSGRNVPELEFWSPLNIRYDIPRKQWISRTESVDSHIAVDRDIDFTSGEHILFAPFGGAGDVSRGLWRSLCYLWLLKQQCIASWANLGNTSGHPPKVVEFALGQQGVNVKEIAGGDEKRKQIVNEIFAMGKRGVISLPPGFTMKLLALPATNAQMFKDQLSAVDTAMAIAVLGQNLTTEIKGGSLAAAQIANTIRADIREFDAGAESRFLRSDVLSWWALLNFGDAEAAPWPVRDTEPPEDLTSAATMLNTLSMAIERFEKNGWFWDKAKAQERFRMPLMKDLPNTEKKPATTAPAAPASKETANAA